MKRCEGTGFDAETGEEVECKEPASTTRRCRRFEQRNDHTVIVASLSLCEACAARFDEYAMAGSWETIMI